jgi:hypothetical protein
VHNDPPDAKGAPVRSSPTIAAFCGYRW